MPEAPGIIDTRHLFRPVSGELAMLLRSLPADAWRRLCLGTVTTHDGMPFAC